MYVMWEPIDVLVPGQVRGKARQFLVRDASLLLLTSQIFQVSANVHFKMQEVWSVSQIDQVWPLQLRNALAKFGLRDELLCQSLLPPLLRRITDKTKWEDTTIIRVS